MNAVLKIFLFSFLIAIIYSCGKNQENSSVQIKVMSFNIWNGGGKSIQATAQVFVQSEADIIGVQESGRDNKNIAVHLADSLGWYSFAYNDGQTILSKYPIVDTSAQKHGVKIKIDDRHFVWMFNTHLMYSPYEPYQLNGIEYCNEPILYTAEEAVRSALTTREVDVNSNIADILEVSKEGYPVFLTGDFNEPSCLDWTARAVEAGLCKIPVEWPSTKAIMDKAKMKDSYRTFYSDEVEKPGYTWTTLPETVAYKEVLDRIDFVFYYGDKVQLSTSQIVGEPGSMSDISFENYPSDHRALLSTFIIE